MKTVMKKIQKFLTKNVGIKIIAVFVAALVWLAVVNVSDPEKTILIKNVPITVTHKEVLSSVNMSYDFKSSKYVDITVSGKRSEVSDLTADDFQAKISLIDVTTTDSIPIRVSAKTKSASRVTIIKQSQEASNLSIQNIIKKTFKIEVNFSGEVADGYAVGSHTISRSTVVVRAPRSVMNKISKVAADCYLGDNSSDFSDKCKLHIENSKGEEITDANTTISTKRVTVNVEVLKTKSIPIEVSYTGVPASGFTVNDMTLSKSKITVMGKEDLINKLTKLEVKDGISVSYANSDLNKKIDLTSYLPSGITSTDDLNLDVKVKIEKQVTKTYSINTSAIEVKNARSDVKWNFTAKKIKITAIGPKSEIDKTSTKNIVATVDLQNTETGKVKVPVSVSLPERVDLKDKVFAELEIK